MEGANPKSLGRLQTISSSSSQLTNDCPDPLTAEVDQSVECVLVSEGTSFTMQATINNVDGDTANINYALTEEL